MAYVFLHNFWLRPLGVALLVPVQDLSELLPELLLMLPALFTDHNLECVVELSEEIPWITLPSCRLKATLATASSCSQRAEAET